MYLCSRSAAWGVAGISAAWAVALGVVLANPTDAKPHIVDVSSQTVTLAAMVGLLVFVNGANSAAEGCRAHTRVSWAVAALLGGSLVLRAPFFCDANQAALGRWDSAAATFGIVAFFTQAYFALVPNRLRWRLGYASMLFVALPLLTALPNMLRAAKSERGVDRAMLLEAADAAAEAYARRDINDAATDTHAAVLGRCVAFAGTQSKKDVKTDLAIGNAVLPPELTGGRSSGARVHAGFLRAYMSVRGAVQAAAARVASGGTTPAPGGGGKTVVFCGHSLGGALATLAALDYAASKKGPCACVTFGSPQVGDALLTAAFDAAVPLSVRVVNPYDLVPRSLSSQLEHVKGYYFVASPRPAQDFVGVHSMRAYRAGAARGRAASWALMLAPAGYALAFLGLMLGAHALWRRLPRR